MRSGSLGTVTEARRPSTAVSWRPVPSLLKRTLSTLPFFTALRNSLYLHWEPSGRSEDAGVWVFGAVRRRDWEKGEEDELGVVASACMGGEKEGGVVGLSKARA